MRLRERYRRLNLWNKLAAWGSLASIVSLAMTLFMLGSPKSREPEPIPLKENEITVFLKRLNAATAATDVTGVMNLMAPNVRIITKQKEPLPDKTYDFESYRDFLNRLWQRKRPILPAFDTLDSTITLLDGGLRAEIQSVVRDAVEVTRGLRGFCVTHQQTAYVERVDGQPRFTKIFSFGESVEVLCRDSELTSPQAPIGPLLVPGEVYPNPKMSLKQGSRS